MAVPTPPATSFIVAKGWFLLENAAGKSTIGNVPGFQYGQVVSIGSDVIYEPGLVLLYRTAARLQVTIDDTVYYLVYDNPQDVILFYEEDES